MRREKRGEARQETCELLRNIEGAGALWGGGTSFFVCPERCVASFPPSKSAIKAFPREGNFLLLAYVCSYSSLSDRVHRHDSEAFDIRTLHCDAFSPPSGSTSIRRHRYLCDLKQNDTPWSRQNIV